MRHVDTAIIGGGILGLATAYRLTRRYPDRAVVILEKEADVAAHQTGRNSGVLHSGIYYKPGSLKARNCREGKAAMERFCAEHGIDYDVCGKVIVAIDRDELAAMDRIYERGRANGVRCRIISRRELSRLEPHCAGIKAIHVPEAGIVDYTQVSRKLADLVREGGGDILFDTRVARMDRNRDGTVLRAGDEEVHARLVVNCGGLYNDKLTKMSGQKPEAKIVPFRGEYYVLRPEARELCRNLIYPVPDPGFPFLGVHFTRMIDGSVECGPNAVLAFAREGYRKTDLNVRELIESLTYRGFIRLAARYWRTGAGEMWRSISKAAFVKALRRLVPEIAAHHLETGPAGVRAQALRPDGAMVDDFLIQESDRVVNICNAPSPAATSSLNIADLVVDKLASRF